MKKITKTESEWKELLSKEEYRVLRKKGTERPNTGKYVHWDQDGVFTCKACGLELFKSNDKFDSGTGWPSFSDVMKSDAVVLKADNSWFMKRTEVVCSRCESHLGHVFDDGPNPTGKRYCINSVALSFKEDK